MTLYLSADEVLAFHQDVIRRFGGSQGLRDREALESACARPQSGYYADLVAEAAALMESLAGNHPFVDGNKRTAVAAVEVFLSMNGYRLSGDRRQIFTQMISLFEVGNFKFDAVEAMLRDIVVPSQE